MYMKNLQRKFLDQQIEDKENRAREKRHQENLEAEYTRKINHMRAVGENQHQEKKKRNEEETDKFNQRIHLQKKINKENQSRKDYLDSLERKKVLDQMFEEKEHLCIQE